MKQDTVIQIPATFYVGMYTDAHIGIENIARGTYAPLLTLSPPEKWPRADLDCLQKVCIGTATLSIDFFTKDKITANQVAALQEQLRQHRINAERAERAILDQISNLQALNFEG